MSILADKKKWTPEELLTHPDEKSFELVNGELVERNMGAESSWVGGELLARLREAAEGSGRVFPADTGFQCFSEEPERVRKPDVSFVRAGRLPGDRIPKGHVRIAPDLVVEVVSPNDLYSEVQRKVGEYLSAGVPLVWVIDPDTRHAEVLRADGSVSRLGEEDEFDGEHVVPGFRCRLKDILPDAEQTDADDGVEG